MLSRREAIKLLERCIPDERLNLLRVIIKNKEQLVNMLDIFEVRPDTTKEGILDRFDTANVMFTAEPMYLSIYISSGEIKDIYKGNLAFFPQGSLINYDDIVKNLTKKELEWE